MDTVFETLRFHHCKLRLRVDGRKKRKNKYAFSTIYVCVWTGFKKYISSNISTRFISCYMFVGLSAQIKNYLPCATLSKEQPLPYYQPFIVTFQAAAYSLFQHYFSHLLSFLCLDTFQDRSRLPYFISIRVKYHLFVKKCDISKHIHFDKKS